MPRTGKVGHAGALAFVLGALIAVPALALTVHGGAGNDVVRGTRHADKLNGRGGSDLVEGRKGKDLAKGGKGRDTVLGGKGRDKIKGGQGEDELNALENRPKQARGRDVIKARDGYEDRIVCGAGRDKAIVDTLEDGVFDCEKVVEP
jgi:Ca2+-binding RTX toxin-like protein